MIDPTVKTEKVPKMVDEFIFWSTHLNYGLWNQKSRDRVLQPRPVKINEDTAKLFGGNDDGSACRECLKQFIESRCDQAGAETTTIAGIQPSNAVVFEEAVRIYFRIENPNAI